MFGYVAINQEMLNEEQRSAYRSYYCGVCRALRERYGIAARLLLNYDLAFLAILLTALYKDDDSGMLSTQRCLLHPRHTLPRLDNEYVDYAADMTLLLAYRTFCDHWQDDKNQLARVEAALMRKTVKKIEQQYPRQASAIDIYICAQNTAEQCKESNPETVANLTGRMLSEIFVYKQDEWQDRLRKFGFHLGKFIYLMDAYEDIDKDIKKGRFNPLIPIRQQVDFEQRCADMLNVVMADCAAEFERLPILLHADLLRNILYVGVWSRYEIIHRHRTKRAQQAPHS